MVRYILTVFVLLSSLILNAQAKVDLDRSVPIWMEYNETTNEAILKWIGDENATNYFVSEVGQFQILSPLATLEGPSTEYGLGILNPGEVYNYHIRKDANGRGIINVGIEVPAVHERGRCLIVIDDILVSELAAEITQLIMDIEMDGWKTDTIHVNQNDIVTDVKGRIQFWYEDGYDGSQSLFLLGHVPVPYSGNTAHDGHGDHQGAWAADVYYGDMDGNWTDIFVNNTSPSRDVNKNIPGDGKFDQSKNPSFIELEIGRVDFHNLPTFEEDEIELTRNYLIKNHEFKMGMKEYPRRAVVENNFSSFPEGFAQSAWRNFPAMLGAESVSVGNFDVLLETEKHLCSYACGGGSYTSASGIGSTANLWAAKEMQTIFTMTFGSYFGDWDSQNNFLRGALASGDILTNAWSGRPVWQLFDMGLGHHIGYSTLVSQHAAGSFYNSGNSSQSAHMALMGDPTLRLHPVKPAQNLSAIFNEGDIDLSWEGSSEATHGYYVYRRENNGEWILIADLEMGVLAYSDRCVVPNTDFSYMVKSIKLEESGCGSYFNTSLGIITSIMSEDNPNYTAYYPDADMDGFGDPDGLLYECVVPPGFADNGLDCDDTNSEINPNGIEIPNNGIDEDCNGEDLLVNLEEVNLTQVNVFPNPSNGYIHIEGLKGEKWTYSICNAVGAVLMRGNESDKIEIQHLSNGIYWIKITMNQSRVITRPIFLVK